MQCIYANGLMTSTRIWNPDPTVINHQAKHEHSGEDEIKQGGKELRGEWGEGEGRGEGR